MTISAAELASTLDKTAGITLKKQRLARLSADVATYTNGGEMSAELQGALRDFLAPKLQARLDLLQAAIDADVALVKALVPDYAG